MTPARKTAGRVAFVGSGPGDAGLLTVRAQELLAKAEVVVTDPDVPASVLAFAAPGAEVRPAVGEPSDVAKDLTAEAKAGRLALRLVSGDPLTSPAVVAEVQAVARTSAVFDVIPGVGGRRAGGGRGPPTGTEVSNKLKTTTRQTLD
ncbi:SAM-dependent methyltransferase, partial [Amycolatopsis sp. NPDC000740]|uniref:SAM-dependent methyltransferase n=1 Tax=Amycolatopsis sp. NPDC000740 TaxID=3154269 RepID=UPI003329ECF3